MAALKGGEGPKARYSVSVRGLQSHRKKVNGSFTVSRIHLFSHSLIHLRIKVKVFALFWVISVVRYVWACRTRRVPAFEHRFRASKSRDRRAGTDEQGQRDGSAEAEQ